MLRVLAVALGMWLAYSWKVKEREPGSPGARARASPPGAYALLALLFVAAFLLEYTPVFWAVRHGLIDLSTRGLSDVLPLHAFLVGALVGFLFADQTLADERAAAQAARAGDGKQPPPPGVLRTAIANGGIAVLVLAAVVPPSGLAQVMGRLQNFEAAGVKLSFAGAAGSNLAEAIRTASPPRSQWTGNAPSAKGGFVPIRLDTMVELTHPPRVVSGDGDGNVFRNPMGYLSADLGSAAPPDRAAFGHTRRVQRDRALLWQLASANPGAEKPAAAQERLRDLGRAQEGFLALFGQHVTCLAGFIDATRDRRLVDYRNVHLVQDLFVLAHTWSKYEKRAALQRLGTPAAERRQTPVSAVRFPRAAVADAAGAGDRPPVAVEGGGMATQLGELLRKMHAPLEQFNRWIQGAMGDWAAAGSFTPQEGEAFQACGRGASAMPALKDSLDKLSHDEALLEASGFTPYVTIFVAQALSALDDHGAAVELLVDWLDDLDELEAAARKQGRTGHERQTAWFRLQALVEALVLQKLSENSTDSVPTTVPALRAAIDVVFPAVIDKLADAETVAGWRKGSNACRTADQRWKQGVVLSYLSWVKEYLDLLQRDLAENPSRFTARDGRRAELLADIEFECFDWILVDETKQRRDPLALPLERAVSRLEFMTSAAVVRALDHEAGRASAPGTEDRDRRLERTASDLRGAIEKLVDLEEQERSLGQTTRGGSLRRLIFPEPKQELLSNARAVLARIEASRKAR